MKDIGDMDVFVCQKCGMVSLTQELCSICENKLIKTNINVQRAACKGFTNIIHALRCEIKTGSSFNRKAWKLRKKTVRNDLYRNKNAKALVEAVENEEFLTILKHIQGENPNRLSGANFGLISAISNSLNAIDMADDIFSKYIMAYTEAWKAISNSNSIPENKQESLWHLTQSFKQFINSQYLAGQQEGIDACNIFINEILAQFPSSTNSDYLT